VKLYYIARAIYVTYVYVRVRVRIYVNKSARGRKFVYYINILHIIYIRARTSI